MKKIAIIACSDLPIPAVKGGAVELGITQIIDENEKNSNIDIDIFSYYDKVALNLSKKYKKTKFYYFTPNKMDKIVSYIIRIINKLFLILKIKRKICIRHKYVNYIGKIIKGKKYDAILVKNSETFVIPLKKYTDSPIYLQLHNDILNSDTPNAQNIISTCTEIVTNSEYIKSRVLSIPNSKKDKIKVNLNCLGNDSFKKATSDELQYVKNKYGIDEKKTIIYTGRIIPEKGIKELLKAVELLPNELDWQLLIVGSKWFGKTTRDKFLSDLEDICSNLKGRVKFTGFIPHEKLFILYSLADIAVVPSIWEEPAGRVVLEAQAVGTPVIVSDAGGIQEYVSNKSAMIVKRGDTFVQELSKDIKKLLTDEDLRSTMAKESINFSIKYNAHYYYNDIMRILGVSDYE